MDNEEIIELFFSKYNEQAFNEKILEDIDYEIPHDLVLNYVQSVIQVPFNEYVDYIITHTDDEFDPIEIEGIPTFYNLVDCRERMIDLMLMEDNRGLKLMEIGSYIKTHSISLNPGYTVVGRKSIQVAETLGIVYEYYNHWYLNCVAYVFDELSRQELQAFYARAILRNSFVKMLLVLCSQGRVSIYDFLFDPYQEVNISTLRSIEFWHSTLHRAICKPYHLHEIEELEELHEREEKKAMNAVRGDLWSRKTDFDVSSYVDEVCVAEIDLDDPLAYEPKDSMGNQLTYSQAPDGVWVKGYAYSTYSREVPSMVDNDGFYAPGRLPNFTREIALLLKDKTSSAGIHNNKKMEALVRSQMQDYKEKNNLTNVNAEDAPPNSTKKRQQTDYDKILYLKQEELEQVSFENQDKRQEILQEIKRLTQLQNAEKRALERKSRKLERNAKLETQRKERLQKRLEEYNTRLERKKQDRLRRDEERIKHQQLAEKRAKERAERERVQAEQRAREREIIKQEYAARKERERQEKLRKREEIIKEQENIKVTKNDEPNSVKENEVTYKRATALRIEKQKEDNPSSQSSKGLTKLSVTNIPKLSQLFKNVSTTYKFFWMLALIDAAESPNFNGKLIMRAVTARMVANAWSVLASGINLPKTDKLPLVAAEAKKFNINTATKHEAFRGIYAIQDTNFHRLMDQLEANVPYRFLSPWIPYSSDQQVVRDSNDKNKLAPYSIKKQGRASEIHITDEWKDYFRTNASTLRRMTYSALAKYLHNYNPTKTEEEIVATLHG